MTVRILLFALIAASRVFLSAAEITAYAYANAQAPGSPIHESECTQSGSASATCTTTEQNASTSDFPFAHSSYATGNASGSFGSLSGQVYATRGLSNAGSHYSSALYAGAGVSSSWFDVLHIGGTGPQQFRLSHSLSFADEYTDTAGVPLCGPDQSWSYESPCVHRSAIAYVRALVQLSQNETFSISLYSQTTESIIVTLYPGTVAFQGGLNLGNGLAGSTQTSIDPGPYSQSYSMQATSTMVYLDPITPGASYSSDSGHSYASPALSDVPEPSTLALIAVGGGLLFLRRRLTARQ
jgi:hypothetical protein